MLEALSLVLMLAESPAKTTLPRRLDPPAAETPPAEQRQPTDPLYDRPMAATDDAAFVLSAVENARQGVTDTRAAAAGLATPELRSVAGKIGAQQKAALAKLESLAKAKGWRLPEGNPDRTNTVAVVGSEARNSADFIIHQIASHQSTVDQFRAQLTGEGDAELRRVLRAALPGYQKNLEMLLGLKL